MRLYFQAYNMEYPQFRIDVHGGDMNQALIEGRRIMSGLYIAVHFATDTDSHLQS